MSCSSAAVRDFSSCLCSLRACDLLASCSPSDVIIRGRVRSRGRVNSSTDTWTLAAGSVVAGRRTGNDTAYIIEQRRPADITIRKTTDQRRLYRSRHEIRSNLEIGGMSTDFMFMEQKVADGQGIARIAGLPVPAGKPDPTRYSRVKSGRVRSSLSRIGSGKILYGYQYTRFYPWVSTLSLSVSIISRI